MVRSMVWLNAKKGNKCMDKYTRYTRLLCTEHIKCTSFAKTGVVNIVIRDYLKYAVGSGMLFITLVSHIEQNPWSKKLYWQTLN